MSQQTTTPGPWHAVQRGDDYKMEGAKGARVFSIRNGVIPMNADARLIAAAPELRDALGALLLQSEAACIEGPYNIALVEALHAARAALAKVSA